MKVHLPKESELSDYYKSYLKYVHTDDLLQELSNQKQTTQVFLKSISPEMETYRYEAGKWSVREVAGHLVDTELILLYRALRFARKDETPLSGFDENSYTANANYHTLSLSNIASQLGAIRSASIALFQSFPDEAFNQTGLANNNKVSVRALLFFIIGHQAHHLEVIKQRYLNR